MSKAEVERRLFEDAFQKVESILASGSALRKSSGETGIGLTMSQPMDVVEPVTSRVVEGSGHLRLLPALFRSWEHFYSSISKSQIHQRLQHPPPYPAPYPGDQLVATTPSH
jgi:hypothetical protein